jgi:hypothetical protein
VEAAAQVSVGKGRGNDAPNHLADLNGGRSGQRAASSPACDFGFAKTSRPKSARSEAGRWLMTAEVAALQAGGSAF